MVRNKKNKNKKNENSKNFRLQKNLKQEILRKHLDKRLHFIGIYPLRIEIYKNFLVINIFKGRKNLKHSDIKATFHFESEDHKTDFEWEF